MFFSKYDKKLLRTVLDVSNCDKKHSQKKRKDLHTFIENQAIRKSIPLYRAFKCKQTKEQDSEDCLWTHIFTFLCDYCHLFLSR